MSVFTLELWKGEPYFRTPTGGSTLLPLNATWAGHNATFAVDDNFPFDLGSRIPNITSRSSPRAFGRDYSHYTRDDRIIKFTLFITANTPTDLKNAVYALDGALAEANEFASSGFTHNGLGANLGGFQLFLKYQPDGALSPVYFQVKSGYADKQQFNDQIKLLNNTAHVPIELFVSYAAYGDAVYLENLLPNGTFAYGFTSWTGTVGYNYTGTQTGFQLLIWNGSQYVGPPNAPVHESTQVAVDGGYEYLWDGTSDTYSCAGFFSPGTTGFVSLYSATMSLVSAKDNLTLSFEFSDSGPTSPVGPWMYIRLEYFDGTAWQILNTLSNNPNLIVSCYGDGGNGLTWTKYSWNGIIGKDILLPALPASYNQSSTLLIRLAIYGNNAAPASYAAYFRKISVNRWPPYLPTAMKVLPTEYMAQSWSQAQSMVVQGLRGNLETNARLKVINPYQGQDFPAPSLAPTAVAGGAGGTFAEVNTYYIAYTWTKTATNQESSISPGQTQAITATTQKITGTEAQARPSGITGANWYISKNPNNAPFRLAGSTVAATTFDFGSLPVATAATPPRNPIYQQLYLGSRKQIGRPFKPSLNHFTTTSNYNIPPSATFVAEGRFDVGGFVDALPRQYRMLMQIKTFNDAVTFSYVKTSRGYATPVALIPNQSILKIPLTSGVYNLIDCGTITLPNATILGTIDGGYSNGNQFAIPDYFLLNAYRLPGSTTDITVILDRVWLLPVDDFHFINTRTQANSCWTNHDIPGQSGVTGINGLVIDSLLKEQANVYLADNTDYALNSFAINPLASKNPLKLYPSNLGSNQPMLFTACVLQTGSAGNPALTVNTGDPLTYSLLYCPAYEF